MLYRADAVQQTDGRADGATWSGILVAKWGRYARRKLVN